MKIAVVGTGYVGLVTGACLAGLGHEVICVDSDTSKVERMRRGELPLYEPGLEELFDTAVSEGRLHFTTALAEAVPGAAAIFLALPTPPGADGAADLRFVLGVADNLGPLLKEYAVIIDKSTVPVGTSQKVRDRIAAGTQAAFDVVSNPEFLQEGIAVRNFMEPSRIVVGTRSERARSIMLEVYQGVYDDEHPLIFMDEQSAELTKYAANSFLATKITFMNEIAGLCERVGADVDMVRRGIGSDPRIGEHFLQAGIGYGGSCFPKDIQALYHTAHELGQDFTLLQDVITANTDQQGRLQQKVLAYFDGQVSGKTFALWGIAFKADTDDIREAPALRIVTELTAKGAKIVAYDPEATNNARRALSGNKNVTFTDDHFAALQGADALLIATEWGVFRAASPEAIKQALAQPVVFDGRNIFDPEVMRSAGFYYASIGRNPVDAIRPASDSQTS
ncbi:MAG TPA: UDP-glucose/GDP-mannose dehydrogenase family protein [Bacillota bacterium]|nr:UDP-glucose/GDP-mannose dehydrogenase family protein [Bacillota bacterium]